jgi:hypothetical protein
METRKILTILGLGLGLTVWAIAVSEAGPMSTAFTYQGRLTDANEAADGIYDFNFGLYDSASDGERAADDVNVADVDVIDGYFTVELDFGSDVFEGSARWLEIGMRPGYLSDPNVFTVLEPRHELTPTPYALHTYGLTVVGDNTFIGKDAGTSNTTGHSNTFSGYQAGSSNTEGYENTFSGYQTGYSNTTGRYNTFSGYYAGRSNTTAHFNTFSGYMSGRYNTTGYANTFSGYEAGFCNTTGYRNTFLGNYAGMRNTTGNCNTFSGSEAGFRNTTGYYNTFSGYSAGYYNREGSRNTIIGCDAGRGTSAHNKSGNVFIGYQAGYYETGSNKLYIENSDSSSPLIYGDFDSNLVAINGQLQITGGSPVAGEVLTCDASGLATWQTASTGWATDGNNIYSAVYGNVGIGTTDPESKLDIREGDLALLTNDGSKGFRFQLRSDGDFGEGGSPDFNIRNCRTNYNAFTIDEDTSNVGLGYVNPGTARLAINGNVGIGTTNPQSRLHIAGGGNWDLTTTEGNFKIGSDTHRLKIGVATGGAGAGYVSMRAVGGTNSLNLGSGTEDVMTIKNGNVGIGATSPDEKLTVLNGTIKASTSASAGKAISGYATNAGVNINYGGYFESAGQDGIGVYGWGKDTGDVDNYGGRFKASGTYGKGVLGNALGSHGIGVFGWGGQWDFYAANSNYGPFTGGHEVKLADNFPTDVMAGMIVSVTGQTEAREDEDGQLYISSTLPTVKLADGANDKAVFGAFVGEAPLPHDHWYQSTETERFGTVNALGEGRVWVSNMNGKIEAGDYITTSSVPGYGQRQNDDLLHSYTLGKAIETVDWDVVTDTIQYNGQTLKLYLIAVIYTSG